MLRSQGQLTEVVRAPRKCMSAVGCLCTVLGLPLLGGAHTTGLCPNPRFCLGLCLWIYGVSITVSGSAREPAALEFPLCSGAAPGSDGCSGCAKPWCWQQHDGEPFCPANTPTPHTSPCCLRGLCSTASLGRPSSVPRVFPKAPSYRRTAPDIPAGLCWSAGSCPPSEAAELSRCPPEAAAGRGRAEEPPLRGRGAIRAARRGAGRSRSHGEPCHPRGL